MLRHWTVRIVGLLFAGSLLLALGAGTLVLLGRERGALELSAARDRWATRSFTHYRMELEYGTLGYCRQSVEVGEQGVVAVLQNTCKKPAPTVDDLFDRIERDMVMIAGRCGPNGCGCDGTIVVSAVYDTRLGFPHSKRVYLDSLARWRFPEYWKQRLSGELCSYRDFGRDIITVVSLTPRL
jgi:hypothetical protein